MWRWLINGEAGAAVAVEDRGLAYGDGLFETIAVRSGRLRLLPRHLHRLREGCARLQLPAPDEMAITDALERAISGDPSGVAKVIVTRGAGPRGYAPPERPAVTTIVGFGPASEPALVNAETLNAVLCAQPASENRALAGLKTLNRLDNVLARRETLARGAGEGLMLGASGQLVGGTMSNVFLVIGGGLVTPALDEAGVAGVMRGVVLELGDRMGLRCDMRRVMADELGMAEEIFVTNSLMGVRSIVALDGTSYPQGAVSGKIRQALAAMDHRDDP